MKKKVIPALSTEPRAVGFSEEVVASTRRNRAASIERTDRFKNIEDGLVPFRIAPGSFGNSNMDIRDAVILCQKAYYNFAIFRNTIDLMTEFSVSPIYFRGGSSKSRDFFDALLKKINIADLQDVFFREYYRSGNVFLYRFDVSVKEGDINRLTQTFGLSSKASMYLPNRYIVLNPSDIQVGGSMAFSRNLYYKVLNDYELSRLKMPQTAEDKELVKNLPPEIRDLINKGGSNRIAIPLDPKQINAVFYKKQHYEPFAVPMGYPVLDDLNWKSELKKMDMAMMRSMQQIILLVTTGAAPDEGGVNPKNLEALDMIFQNESVGRVLVADYTTKAQFIVPQVAELMNPAKYEVVNDDIRLGLNNILIGSEKFANQSIKVQVFVERLKQARQSFINDFLILEIKRIAEDLGFKNFPTPYFEDIDLKDAVEFSRLYTRLAEIGILTAEETLTAFETGRLPTSQESLESQDRFKQAKDKGYYQPITGGPQNALELAKQTGQFKMQQSQLKQQKGRPPGTGKPINKKKVGPIGASYSLSSLHSVIEKSNKIWRQVEGLLLSMSGAEKLDKAEEKALNALVETVITNEPPENWETSINEYLENPTKENNEYRSKVEEVAATHGLSPYVGALLLASKT